MRGTGAGERCWAICHRNDNAMFANDVDAAQPVPA